MQPAPPRVLQQLIGKSAGSVGELLVAQAQRRPQHAFIVDGDNNITITFAEALANSRRAAGFLQAHGYAGQEHCVVSLLSHRRDAFWGWFGSQILGTVHAFLNWEHRGELLLDMMARTEARLLITEAAGWELISDINQTAVEAVLFLDEIPGSARESGLTLYTLDDMLSCPEADPAPVGPGDISALIFSSGSTGRSKAVQIPHNMLVRGAARMAEAMDCDDSDVIHFTSPLYHIGGQLHTAMVAVASGARLALFSRFSRSQFWQQVNATGATHMSCFSNVMRYLLGDPETPDDANNTLRTAMIAQADSEELATFAHRFGITPVDSYGMTEGEPITLPVPLQGELLNSCGRVNPDFEVAVLDAGGNQLPLGEKGVIAFRPRAPYIMMQGYLGDPEKTVEAWSNLWFHTQDIGYLDEENYLYYVERMKFTIRRRGENIIPAELEAVVRNHPDVEDCVAVGVAAGTGEQDIKLIVSAIPGSNLNQDDIFRFCKDRVARFMHPQLVELVDSLPYTPAGKIDRKLLADAG